MQGHSRKGKGAFIAGLLSSLSFLFKLTCRLKYAQDYKEKKIWIRSGDDLLANSICNKSLQSNSIMICMIV